MSLTACLHIVCPVHTLFFGCPAVLSVSKEKYWSIHHRGNKFQKCTRDRMSDPMEHVSPSCP